MSLRPLPAPDVQLFAWPEGHVALLVDDGTPLLSALVRRLTEQAWPVVVLRPPDTIASDSAGQHHRSAGQHHRSAGQHHRSAGQHHRLDRQPLSDVPVVQLPDWSESAVAAACDQVGGEHGAVAACVVLAPPAFDAPAPAQTDEGAVGAHHRPGQNRDPLAALAARQSVRLAFLLAKHLHDQLTEAARWSWAGFFTVTRLDGMWGLTGSPRVLTPTSGLAGLTKTLRLEWPAVASRAVDLAPDLAPDAAAALLIGEMLDPNSALLEVGWGSDGRMTLDAVVGAVTAAGEERVDG